MAERPVFDCDQCGVIDHGFVFTHRSTGDRLYWICERCIKERPDIRLAIQAGTLRFYVPERPRTASA